jgi:hypothetical protein
MGTLNIGRVGLDVTLADPTDWSIRSLSVNATTHRIRGWLTAASLAQTKALRSELVAQIDRLVAVTYSEDSSNDGFYRVDNVTVDARHRYGSLQGTGLFAFNIGLELIGSEGQVEFQSLVTSTVLTNDHGLVQAEVTPFLAPPVGHQAFKANTTGFPTQRTRTTADSATDLDWYDDIDPDADPTWSCAPTSYYDGAARLYVAGYLRAGLDPGVNDPGDWELSNGLVKVTPGGGGTSNGRIEVSWYDGAQWDTADSFSIWYNATTEIPEWHYGPTPLFNEPHEVRIRLVRDANDTEGSRAHTLDLTLRRGSRSVFCYYTWNGSTHNIEVGQTTTDAGTAITVSGQTSSPGLVASSATDGNKWVLATPHTHSQDTTNGQITRSASTTMAFMIGAEVGTPGAGDAADDLVTQYLGWVSEQVRAVRR